MIDICELDLSKKPDISIWCLTYNFGPYIKTALNSFLEQETEYSFEIVVHDDCSTDDTVTILKEYQQRYPDRFRLLLEEVNQRTKHLHRFLDKVRGEYVAICEGDDYWVDKRKLQKQVSFLKGHKEYSLCFHANEINDEGNIVPGYKPYNTEKSVGAWTTIIRGGRFCPSASLVFKRDLLDILPGYYFVANISDYPMQIFLSTKGRVKYYPEIMSVYRRNHPGSFTTTMKRNPDAETAFRKNEISWLMDADKETRHKYWIPFYTRITMYKLWIWKIYIECYFKNRRNEL